MAAIRVRHCHPLPAPQLAALVASILHELHELEVGHGRARDPERLDVHVVGPLLVVEDERGRGRRAQPKGPAGHGHVAAQRAVGSPPGRRAPPRDVQGRLGIRQCLPHERERLRVHVLVPGREQDQVGLPRIRRAGREPLEHRAAHALHVLARLLPRGEGEVPAVVVLDGERVVEVIPLGDGALGEPELAKEEDLVEEGHVADFPQEGVDDLASRNDELVVVQVVHQLGRASPGLVD